MIVDANTITIEQIQQVLDLAIADTKDSALALEIANDWVKRCIRAMYDNDSQKKHKALMDVATKWNNEFGG